MVWSHGHKKDWDFFANEVADSARNYESVMNIYRRIEPRVTSGNTMAPCVVIGERAAEILKGTHGMS
jgi:choline dehydrogenase-like flavoprotein